MNPGEPPCCGELLPAQQSVTLNDEKHGEREAPGHRGGCRDNTTERLYVPGGAMQADGLQVLCHTLVVLDLSRDRNRRRGDALTANNCNRLAVLMTEETRKL